MQQNKSGVNVTYKQHDLVDDRNLKKRKGTDKPYKCDQCDYCCTRSGHLTTHKRTQCDYCCSRSEHLKIHKQIHTDEKPYKCDQCDYCCSQSGSLKTHKRTHTGEKPYKCDQCDYCCSESGHLTRHKRTHTGEKPYKCDQCDYCCTTNGALKTHKRTHTGERPYKCDQCDYCCSKSGHLKTHKRTHTGEKPYKCDQCDYCCSKSGTLTVHKRTHTGEKPYKCDHCYKCFTTSSNRATHHKMHEEQKKFKFFCMMQDCGTQKASEYDLKCTIRCKTLLDLDYHIQRHHTDEGIAKKFKSEQQLAAFFDKNNISYDRDWLNRIAFTSCKNIEGSRNSARPDFYLHAKSAELGCIFLVGNDEFAHRQTKCEFQRIFNIANALEQTDEFKNVPIIYIRFNPHFFRKNGTYYDIPLHESHKLLLHVIDTTTHVKPGVNLIYVNYDTNNHSKLCIFDDAEDDSYSKLFIDNATIIF